MPQERLDGSDVVAVLEQVRRERVAQGVGAGALGQRGLTDRELEGPLQDRLVQVVAPQLAGQPVSIESRGRENPLPDLFPAGVPVLPRQGGG